MNKKFGTAPVFFTAISTILGAILFLRFGYAVGSVGIMGAVLIILLGHLVTIPTSLAISEIATNKRVEGGGEYFIISRSFGLNIGATIGIALYLSQAISIAFYVMAFTEAFDFFFKYMAEVQHIDLPRQAVSIPSMLFLSLLIIKQGANIGVKALYVVVAVLAVSLLLFFLGSGSTDLLANGQMSGIFTNKESFFAVFAIVFPAFTGMTAGVGLSGDLKNPGKSIPKGTTGATFAGMFIYLLIAYKFYTNAPVEELVNNQFVMSKIALWGEIIIPIGLAASTISSAIGSIMVAPRTLQALANDDSFPVPKFNNWLKKGRSKDNEPVNSLLLTCLIALVFVALGDVNAVAEVISMFFMVTYGSLCLISFLNHFGASPSYRPSFKSKWYLSLTGFIVSVWVMTKINLPYALVSFVLMIVMYVYINSYHKDRKGLVSIFANAIFQINRNLQLFLQQKRGSRNLTEWRPSVICISRNSFLRDDAYQLLNWISYKYGFGMYLHWIEDYYSKETEKKAAAELQQILNNNEYGNNVYLDSIVSPSYTTAIAQAIQFPGISGMENNMVVFEYDKENPAELKNIIQNYSLVRAGKFDTCILAASRKPIHFKNGIHIWFSAHNQHNANLMILLSFIMLGHPDWSVGSIKIFNICKPEEENQVREKLENLVYDGRLPITSQNIETIVQEEGISAKMLINKHSNQAGLTFIGFLEESLKHDKEELFEGYDELGSILFINSHQTKVIE